MPLGLGVFEYVPFSEQRFKTNVSELLHFKGSYALFIKRSKVVQLGHKINRVVVT